jgi:hypothetical protein
MAARPVVDEEGSVDVVCWKAATVETGKTTGRESGKVVGANRSVGRNSQVLSQFRREISTSRCLW